jgi:hypothetical protein
MDSWQSSARIRSLMWHSCDPQWQRRGSAWRILRILRGLEQSHNISPPDVCCQLEASGKMAGKIGGCAAGVGDLGETLCYSPRVVMRRQRGNTPSTVIILNGFPRRASQFARINHLLHTTLTCSLHMARNPSHRAKLCQRTV